MIHVMHRLCRDDERVDFFFEAIKWEGDPANKEPHRCDQLLWSPLQSLPVNTVPYIVSALASYQSDQFYSEFDESGNKIL